ncbi:MAG: hypothetical protein IPN22_02635 [Bacteroidetes bacterium]|nr:hypothetical protein [Bacteroidota bacterium]
MVYDVVLFGKKIGSTVVEKTTDPNGDIHYKLNSSSEANVLFTKKTSSMNLTATYSDNKLKSSYVKNMKDGVTEIVTVAYKETKYIITKGSETFQYTKPIDFSSVLLYFIEPKTRSSIFSERLGEFCRFVKTAEGRYECKLGNGVNNIYNYENGILTELEMSKGASVFLKLVR